MKRLLLLTAMFTLMCFLPGLRGTAHANPVSVDRAKNIAQSFLSNTLQYKHPVQLQSQAWQFDAVYLFTIPQGGWIMVAADDCARPVLAYSLTGSFNTDTMPVALQNMLSVYQQEINHIRTVKGAPCHEEWQLIEEGKSLKRTEEDEVGPLITTQWFQRSPYNLLCPSSTMTGCVATAMAQVMKYWNYPAFGQGSHSYTDDSGYGTQSADFGNTRYDWPNMPNRLTESSSAIEKTAVATLMYHCGVSVNMHYSTVYSGTTIYKCETALTDFFHYNRHDIRYCAKGQMSNDAWTDTLIAELRHRRPILHGGNGPAGGHCFICDGFNAQRYLHFNLGEDGAGDGYYQVGAITYGAYSFNQANDAILGVHPEYGLYLNTDVASFTRSAAEQQIWFCASDTIDGPWTAMASDGWIQVSDTSFTHLGQVTVGVTENNTGEERTAAVRFSQGSLSVVLNVVQEAYNPATDYCTLTVEMESTHNEPWAGDAHLSFESLSGTVYGIAQHTANSRTSTTTVSVAPHDVMVRWHPGGALDRYINYKVKNQYGEIFVEVNNAYFDGGDVLISWPCSHLSTGYPQHAVHQWAISPNPTTGRLTVTGCNRQPALMEIMDATGRVLLRTSGSVVDLAPLSPGIYYIRIISDCALAPDDNTVIVKKVVKN